jgi:hypothetical protein
MFNKRRTLRLEMHWLEQGEGLLLSRQVWDSAYGRKKLVRQDQNMLF